MEARGPRTVSAKPKVDTWTSLFPRQAVLIGETAFVQDAKSYFASHVRDLSLRVISTDQDQAGTFPPGFPMQGPWCLICDLVTSHRALRMARKILLNTTNVPFVVIGNNPIDIPDAELRGILELGITHVLPVPSSWSEAWTEIRKVLVRRLNPLLSVHSTKMWLVGVLQSLATEERNCCVRISSRSHGRAASSGRDHGTSLRISPVGLLGEIYFREGQPVYAWSTRLQGDEAIIDLLQTSNVQILVLDSGWIPPTKNVQSPLQGVLLEFMRRKDLGQLEPPSAVLGADEAGEAAAAASSGPATRTEPGSPARRSSPVSNRRKILPILGALAVVIAVIVFLLPPRTPSASPPESLPVSSFQLPKPTSSERIAPASALASPAPTASAPSISAPTHQVPARSVEPTPKRGEEADRAPRSKELSTELTLPLSDRVNLDCVLIPAGQFKMGTPEDEPGRNHDEGPVREVVFRASFYMGRFETTQEQYEAIMGQNPSQFKGPRRPVESVSSFDAQEFCERVTKRLGREVRLPTEAEWEYACRAGSSTAFCAGATLHSTEANYDGRARYAGASEGTYRGKTLDVGSFAPNAFGLYDMHGNVGEWCLDFYDPRAFDSPSHGPIPFSPSRPERSWRGGAYNDPPRRCRAGSREHFNPGGRDSTRGFRVVVPPESPAVPAEKR